MSALQLDANGVLSTCPSCGRQNRHRYASLDHRTRCGHCATALGAPAEPIEVPSSAVFDAVVGTSALPVIVDFWAPWCGPCRMVAPELAQVARRAQGTLLVVKVNTEALPELGERYGVRSIPTMAVFRHGGEAARTSGARPAADIEAFVGNALRAAS